MKTAPAKNEVTLCGDIDMNGLARTLAQYGLRLMAVKGKGKIPGSHFGQPEAGLIANRLYYRPDTPVHSVLHESCHYICMDKSRRERLHTDAGGDFDEENAVCYLSILLANELRGYSSIKMMRDMDTWGYTFRLGSARAWFVQDADDAQAYLFERDLIDSNNRPTWRLGA